MKLSIVTTLYNSSGFIPEFLERITAAVSGITNDLEIVMVDDGSPDYSFKSALGLMEKYPQLKIVELSRNFGHHKAMMTGLDHSTGDLVFLIDVDLEEPPEMIVPFYESMKSSQADVVFGVQEARKGGLVKNVGGAFGWWLIRKLIPIKIPENQTTMRLMTREYVNQLTKHKEQKTVIGGLWVITGFHQIPLVFDKKSRKTTSYSLLKRVHALVDSITSFSETPLYLVFFLGSGMFSVSVLVALYLIYLKLTGFVLSGWISVMVSVWGLGGLILLCIGLVGIYISRIFIETKNRPYTIVRKVYEGKQESK